MRGFSASNWVMGPTGVVGRLGTAAAGVLLGLIPNLIFSTLGTGSSVAFAAAGACVVVWVWAGWILRRWSRTVGVVVNLDPGDGRQWDGHAARVALSEMRSQGFRTAPPIEATLPSDPVRRDETLRSVLGRINEAAGRRNRPVALCPFCTLHDAFALGRLIKTGSFPMALVQKSRSDDGGRWFHQPIRLGEQLAEPLSGAEKRQVEGFLRVEPRELAPSGDRLGLMVALSGQRSLIVPAMVEAAERGRSDDYEISPADRCRAALLVEATDGRVPPESFELAVRYIHEQWTTWLDEKDAHGEHLVFLAGPITIAMALGWLYGREGMRFAAHRARRPDPSTTAGR